MVPRAKARVVFVVALALLCLCGLASYFAFSYFRESASLVIHTYNVRDALSDLQNDINTAGRARMAYLMSGDDSQFAEYRTAAAQVPGALQRLQELTKDNPVQVANCNQYQALTSERLRIWDDSLAQKQKGAPMNLSEVLRQNIEFATRNADISSAIRNEEARLLTIRKQTARRLFLIAGAIVITSFIVAVSLLYLHYQLLRGELQARERAEQAALEAYSREAALRQQEERFRLFIQSVKDYAIFTLDREGRVSSWNEGAERLKGYPAAGIIGKHFSIFHPEEDLQSQKPQRELEIASREGRAEDEGWRVRKDGSRFWANVVITAIRDANGEVIGFSKVTRDFTERMHAQEALQRANDDLATEVKERKLAQSKLAISENSLRRLSHHLLLSQDEERKRIGRELHDSLGQYLAMLKMNLDSLEGVLASDPGSGVHQQIAHCIRLAEESIREVRTISYLLYPPMLEELGLKSAIPWYLEGFSKRSKIQVTFEADPDFVRLPREVELALFRILQESLSNVHRHSGSSTASVRLSMAQGMAVLEILDKGRGIPAGLLQGSDETNLGLGLRGMKERMQQLGGNLEIISTEEGTTVVAAAPAKEPVSSLTQSA
ncbi:MAG TPA: PAS domain S-box protein [Terriglobales bacterium]|nr:PAS domain S-box protein [Terriglobales bacterium]